MDEKKNTLLAGASYLLLLLGMYGLIIDCIIYYITKDRYAKFHAGQACFLVMVIVAIVGSIAMIGIFGVFTQSFEIDIIDIQYVPFLKNILSLIYVSLAVAAFLGKEFRIPIAADILEL